MTLGKHVIVGLVGTGLDADAQIQAGVGRAYLFDVLREGGIGLYQYPAVPKIIEQVGIVVAHRVVGANVQVAHILHAIPVEEVEDNDVFTVLGVGYSGMSQHDRLQRFQFSKDTPRTTHGAKNGYSGR